MEEKEVTRKRREVVVSRGYVKAGYVFCVTGHVVSDQQ